MRIDRSMEELGPIVAIYGAMDFRPGTIVMVAPPNTKPFCAKVLGIAKDPNVLRVKPIGRKTVKLVHYEYLYRAI